MPMLEWGPLRGPAAAGLAPRNQMLCARAGSKLGRQGGMWRGQLNPRFWGSPGATQQAPLCMGREGA